MLHSELHDGTDDDAILQMAVKAVNGNGLGQMGWSLRSWFSAHTRECRKTSTIAAGMEASGGGEPDELVDKSGSSCSRRRRRP